MQRANLILHAGASKVERDQVSLVQTPGRTNSWVPVPHDRLLTLVERSLTNAGLDIVSQAHGLTRDGSRYFGLLQVANGTNPDSFGLVVGVRNSHDKSFPAALALGAQVFVCDNLSFSGEVKLARKHTSRIERDLPQLVNRAVGMLADLRGKQEQRFLTYRKTELSNTEANDLTIQALDAQVVPVTKIPDLLKEWREPRHPEFAERTAWAWFNAVTEVLKGNIGQLPKRTQALHGILDAACGLVIPAQCERAPEIIDAEFEVNHAMPS